MFNGFGIIKGLSVTLKHFIETYLDDLRWSGKRYRTPEGIAYRQSSKANGVFTVQYPEEKLPVPEEFRYFPFLLYEDGNAGEGKGKIRCTACGICSKVCPPQCIWIVRAKDPATGKPLQQPVEFNIDLDCCMQCGLCAEFCPFDSIKMDHVYEIATYDRESDHVLDLTKLLKPVSYYASIRPANYQVEEKARLDKIKAANAKKQ
jgi:NADH-quinone oxidoreductase subunit I